MIEYVEMLVPRIRGRGIRRTISISNTIKMMANRKNRMENGNRAVLLGSNPHSNGEDFSRSLWLRDLRNQAVANTVSTRARAIEKAEIEYVIN